MINIDVRIVPRITFFSFARPAPCWDLRPIPTRRSSDLRPRDPSWEGGTPVIPLRPIEVLAGEAGQVANRRGCHGRSEEHTSELQSLRHLVCCLLLAKKK